MNIRELLLGLRNLDLVLPEFQREYVWTHDQAKQLMVSMFKDYPTGSLLFWKTTEPPAIKNNAIDRAKIGSTSVILDGQQRLTTLFLLIHDEVPPYYNPEDIENDPRNLYFNIENGEFLYYKQKQMENNPVWLPVTHCFNNGTINLFEIAKATSESESEQLQFAQQYNENLNRLRNTVEKIYPVQTVPASADIHEAIDVFDRVNSLGTKLTDAELALAHICGRWAKARQVIKDYRKKLKTQHFEFDLTFLVRCLVAVIRGRALFETIHTVSKEEAQDGWSRVTQILDYLIGILPKYAFIHSTEDLNTTNVLVPLVAYLAKHTRFTSDTDIRQAVHWLYGATAWSRYSGQTDTRLDHDLAIIQRIDIPWNELINVIIDQRGRIELKASDLEGRGKGHPLYRMLYILAKSQGAVDWCNGLPLDIKQTGKYSIHSHHIFPQGQLYDEGGYEPSNHLHKKIVNEIANRAFLTADGNWTLSTDLPVQYFEEVESNFPGALEMQFIPQSPALRPLDQYETFLKERRILIADAFNQMMDDLLEDPRQSDSLSIEKLILVGENASLEFKSSLRWDKRTNSVNKKLQKVIAKTVCGFLNTSGGTLIIGVADDGTILGIDDDIKSVSRQDRDGFQQVLTQTLSNYIGESAVQPYIDITFEELDGNEICAVFIHSSHGPVYLYDGDNNEFYIRFGNSTKPLNLEESHNYISQRWG